MTMCKYRQSMTPNTESMTSRQAAKFLGMGKSAINAHRAGNCACKSTGTDEPAFKSKGSSLESAPEWVGRSDVDSVRGGFASSKPRPVGSTYDHAAILAEHDLDASLWEVTSYRRSKWQRHDGEYLEAERLNVVPRKPAEGELEVDYSAAQARLRGYKLPQRIPGSGLGPEVAAVLNLADMQLHKPDGDGITGTLDRLTHGLENFQHYVERQRSTGRNINEVVIVNNGDPFEGIAGNYANQRHTVKAGLRQQMNTVLDVWEMYARELYPQFDKGQFVSVHCNHTVFGRQGGSKDSITGDEDTGSAFLAEALQRILRGRHEFDHVKFTIPHDEMNVYTDIAGVPVGFNHGHKIAGNGADGFEKWLNGQVRGSREAYAARVWITAHKHSLQFFDIGSAQVFQCPSCDGGSKWLRDISGKFSQTGILALLIGEHTPQGWSDNALI